MAEEQRTALAVDDPMIERNASVVTFRTASRPSTTHGKSLIWTSARIAGSPRLMIVIVPPDISVGCVLPDRGPGQLTRAPWRVRLARLHVPRSLHSPVLQGDHRAGLVYHQGPGAGPVRYGGHEARSAVKDDHLLDAVVGDAVPASRPAQIEIPLDQLRVLQAARDDGAPLHPLPSRLRYCGTICGRVCRRWGCIASTSRASSASD
ncbi:hypothetical protein [Nonomuraea sp. 160415]|uniref:hypothetical protein n=1 Tax=Nonomuraea basaltis TaxID=2495887 RepID=UPI00110C4AA4|nr:hypothetical protein EJK15_38485 [Nonomuraea basaltis]